MLGARGGPSAAKKKNATPTSQASKAKGGGGGAVGGRVGDIRSFMVERPSRLDEYNPRLRYRLVRTGKAGNVDLVDLPFKPPDDTVMALGRSSSADKKAREAGAPVKVQLGIPSDHAYISRQQVGAAGPAYSTTATAPAAAPGDDLDGRSSPQALITLTGEGRFTLTNPPTSSRCILVRRGVKVMGEREMKTLAPGDDPCALHVGDVVVLDGNETRPQYTWRFEDDSPKPSPTARAQQAVTALAAAPPASSSSSSSSSSVVPAIQAAVRRSGPENHHPNEPAPTTASPARNKQHKTSSMPPPSTSQQHHHHQQQQAPATDSAPPPPSAPSRGENTTSSSRAVDRPEPAPPTQASQTQPPPAGDGAKKRPTTTTEPPPPAPEVKPAAAAPPAARPTSTSTSSSSSRSSQSSSKAAKEGSPEKPILIDHSDEEDEPPRAKPAARPPRSPEQQAAGGGSQGSSSSAKRGTPTRPICLDLSDYEEEDNDEEDDEVEVVSVTPAFGVGQNVFVTGRTGPGSNKPGGFGRVTAVRETGPGVYHYDVKYVLGGRESQLEACLLHAANYLEDPRPRKRLSSTRSGGGRAGGGGHEEEANKRPRTQPEGGRRPAVEQEDDDDVVDLAGSDSDGDDDEEEDQQGMEVDGEGGEAMEVDGEGGGADWAELKQQRSGASMDDDGDDEESGGEAMEEEEVGGSSQGEGDDVLGLAKHKAKRSKKKAKKKGRGGSSGGEYEEEEDGEEEGGGRQQVVTVRCTLCAKAFKLRCQADSDKMAVHLRQCQRVAVKREKDRRGLASASSELEVAKEMPSSLSVCLSSNLSVQDPSFLLSALERWLAVKQQTVSLKFHQDLLATFLDTACPLRARCFRRILDRLHSSFPPHRFSSSWRPIDVLEFTRLLQSVDTDSKAGPSKDLRRLRSRALLLDYYTTIFEDEVEDLRSRGADDELGLEQSMLGRLVLSVAQGSKQQASQANRLRAAMDLAIKACTHNYVRAGSRSRTTLLALPRSSKDCAKIGKDSLKWFVWSDAPEVKAAAVLSRLLLLMCEVYDASPSADHDDGSFAHANAASLLDNRLKSVPEPAHIKQTERTLYRYMPSRASKVLPGYAAWERRALGGLFHDIKAAHF